MAFPDVGQLVITYLSTALTPTKVGSRVPSQRPTKFVQVRRVGGTVQLPVRDRARLDVWAWDATDPGAMVLALQARTAIWALAGKTVGGVAVYEVAEFLGPRHSDDPETGTPRVWATYELAVRADDAIHLAT